MKSLNEWAKEIHENAVAHGWWDEQRSFGEIVALCHSELSEALEEYRSGQPNVYAVCGEDHTPCGGIECDHWEAFNGSCKQGVLIDKPEGIAVEMADCIIRILDWCGKEGIDMDRMISLKHEYNKSRPYRHGGKRL